MPKYEMVYFPVRGRGEFIRYIIQLGKATADFSERNVDIGAWRADEEEKNS